MIPIINVVAKPCIGPEPKINRIKPVKKVLICESRIEGNACLKPSATAMRNDLPKGHLFTNTFINQYVGINRYTQYEHDTCYTIKVNTAPKLVNTPIRKNMLI
jgi:hypothetical protein